MDADPRPPFELEDRRGFPRAFPTARPALLVFARHDCPTCSLTLPLLAPVASVFTAGADVWLVSQDEDGGDALVGGKATLYPVLDDSACRVSRAWEVETVPTVVLVDGIGRELRRFEGFGREDWKEVVSDLSAVTGSAAPDLDWVSLPESRPGCASRAIEAPVADRIVGEGLASRRIELGDEQDPIELLHDRGLTDGLPVVPPTPERVVRMLAATDRDPAEVLGVVPPNLAPVTVEKVAINAVLAGCAPAVFPVVLAAVEAVLDEAFALHGVLATTYFPGPIFLVNGPIAERVGIASGMNCLGQGHRANLTIGRAVQLLVRNVGGGRPGEIDRATLGQPGKLALCFAENEAASPWPSFAVERGFAEGTSTITAYAGGAPNGFVDQLSRDARSLATSYALQLAAAGHPKLHFHGEILVVVSPEHAAVFERDGWTKDDLREHVQRTTARPARDLARSAVCAEGLPPEIVEKLGPETLVPKFRDPKEILIVVAGGAAGKFGAICGGWLSGPTGSTIVTRPIDEPASKGDPT